MNLNIEQALVDMATRFQLGDPHELVAYCYEDVVGGWDLGQGSWPVGSIWSVEGRILYALTRILKPEFVVEIGTRYGCSATHFASALEANGSGRLICIDNGIDEGGMKVAIGSRIPAKAWERIDLVRADGIDWLENQAPKDMIGLVFEDADHASETTRRVWKAASECMVSGGVIVSHDALHFLVGADIRRGIVESGVQGFEFYAITPIVQDTCGLGMARLPVREPVKVESISEQLDAALQQGEQAAEEYRKANGKKRGRPKKEKATA